MNPFTILIIAFAALVGLVFLAIVAAVLTAGIFFLLPQLEQTWAAVSLWVLAQHAARVAAMALHRSPDNPEPQFAVPICISPLRSTEYLVGLAGRKPVWSGNKADARVICDLLATRA